MSRVILKLGGSMVTKKYVKRFPLKIEDIEQYGKNYIRNAIVKRFAHQTSTALAQSEIELLLINGAGSFGHYLVQAYWNKRLDDVKTIHSSVAYLNKQIVSKFRSVGMEIESYAPFDTCYYKRNKTYGVKRLWQLMLKTLKGGKIPSTYGDIIPAAGARGRLGEYEIISGDDLAAYFVRLWHPDKVIMTTDVDGVYDRNPKIDKSARLIRRIHARSLHRLIPRLFKLYAETVDVTKGMRGKLEKLQGTVQKGMRCQIINGLVDENVKKALLGDESIGTLIVP